MQNCLGELNLMYALIYLDDVIVYSKTKDHLRAMLEIHGVWREVKAVEVQFLLH